MSRPSKVVRFFNNLLYSVPPPRFAAIRPNENRVVAMWNALINTAQAQGRVRPPLRMFSKTEVMPNETGVCCLDNEHVVRIDTGMPSDKGKPIHAHRTRPQSPDIGAGNVVYAAGQSPHAESFKDFLVQALVSKQGIFEIVSRKTHYDAEQSTKKSIIDLLKTEIAKPRDSNSALMFGNRYQYQCLKQVAGKGHANDAEDFVRYELTVIDPDGITIKIPLTQAGLKFKDRVLRPAEIRRADVLLNAHQVAVRSGVDADQTDSPKVQLILSRAGAGRNATLISYHKIASLIECGRVTEATLDDALEEEIYANRMRRGPGYVHSIEQLASLRTALQEKIASIPPLTAPGMTASLRRHSAPAWLNQAVNNAQPVLPPQQMTVMQTPARLHAATALPVQNNGRNDEAITESNQDQVHQFLPNSASLNFVDPIKTQQHIHHEQSTSIMPSEKVGVATLVQSDGSVTHDGPSNPVRRTRYTNNEIDMAKADLLLSEPGIGMCCEQKLAANDGGSWWRAAFISVLLEQAERSTNKTMDAAERIADRVRALGPDFIQEAELLKRMMLQLTNKGGKLESPDGRGIGIRGFMTDLHPPVQAKASSAAGIVFESGINRLKAVGEENDDPDRPGEKALKKIAHAMLLKAGFSLATVDGLFDEDAKVEGAETHIVELMNQLGARKGFILTRPWTQPNPNSSGYPRIDYESATLDIHQMNNPLGEMIDDNTDTQEGDETEKLIYTLDTMPVIVAAHGHFSILIENNEAKWHVSKTAHLG